MARVRRQSAKPRPKQQSAFQVPGTYAHSKNFNEADMEQGTPI